MAGSGYGSKWTGSANTHESPWSFFDLGVSKCLPVVINSGEGVRFWVQNLESPPVRKRYFPPSFNQPIFSSHLHFSFIPPPSFAYILACPFSFHSSFCPFFFLSSFDSSPLFLSPFKKILTLLVLPRRYHPLRRQGPGKKNSFLLCRLALSEYMRSISYSYPYSP